MNLRCIIKQHKDWCVDKSSCILIVDNTYLLEKSACCIFSFMLIGCRALLFSFPIYAIGIDIQL